MRATPTSAFLHSILGVRGWRDWPSKAICRRWMGLMCLLALSAATAWGQATTSIRGAVTDPSGGAIVGASVTLVNTDSKIERKSSTNEDGSFQFTFVSPGTYTLSITATGFQGFEKAGLVLLVNTPATINAQLKIGSASEVVKVTTEEPVLNLVDA